LSKLAQPLKKLFGQVNSQWTKGQSGFKVPSQGAKGQCLCQLLKVKVNNKKGNQERWWHLLYWR
jgi:hypothetical protein